MIDLLVHLNSGALANNTRPRHEKRCECVATGLVHEQLSSVKGVFSDKPHIIVEIKNFQFAETLNSKET